MGNETELSVTGGRFRQMVKRAKGDTHRLPRKSHSEDHGSNNTKEATYERERRAQKGLKSMSQEESSEWVRRFMENDDVLSELEAMDHARNVSPVRRMNSGSSLASTSKRMSYIPASPLTKHKDMRPITLPDNQIAATPPQGVSLPPPPSSVTTYPQQNTPVVKQPQQTLQQDGNAELALKKAAQIMEELQEMASLTGLQAQLPPPPQGVALPPPSATLLPQTSPGAVPLSAPLPPKYGRETSQALRMQEPSPSGRDTPREREHPDTPAEDKWLNASQGLRSRSASRDHPERGRASPVAGVPAAGPGGRGQSAQRVPSPSPSDRMKTGGPSRALWDGGAGDFINRQPRDSAADFFLDRRRSAGGRSVGDDFDTQSRGGYGRDTPGHVRPSTTIRSESPRLSRIHDLDGRLGAPPLSGPGSRPQTPLSRRGSFGGGPPNARQELSTRLHQQRADLQSAVDAEFRAHEANIKNVLHQVDSARSTPIPTSADITRRSPTRPRATSSTRRVPISDPHLAQPQSSQPPEANGHTHSPRLQRALERPSESQYSKASPALSPAGHAAQDPSPYDDWLSRPLQDPFGNEVVPTKYDNTPAPAAPAAQGRVSPTRWGSRDPVGVPVHGSPAERELSVGISPHASPAQHAHGRSAPTSPLQQPRSPLLRSDSPHHPTSPRPDYPDEFPLTIMIDGENGSHTTVRGKHSDSIAEIKAKVQEIRPDIPLEAQRLLFQGREVEDSLKVCDYGIDQSCQMQLLIKKEPEAVFSEEVEALVSSPRQTTGATESKAVWVTSKGKSSVVKMDIAVDDTEGELLHRAKRKLGISTEIDVKPFINGRGIKFVHQEVKEGWVYTLETIETRVPDAGGSGGYGDSHTQPVQDSPAMSALNTPPLIPPPPETAQRRLKKLYDSLQKGGRVARIDVFHGLKQAQNLGGLLAVEDVIPSDAEMHRTVQGFSYDPQAHVEFSEMLREIQAHQFRCQLSSRCWNEQKPWQTVVVGMAVEPVNTILKNRHILQMGLGRVMETITTDEKQTPYIPRFNCARVYFKVGEDQQRVWVRLTDLRIITGSLASQAPQLPQGEFLDFSRISGRNTPGPQGVQSLSAHNTPRVQPLSGASGASGGRLTARNASPSPARSHRPPGSVAGASTHGGRGGQIPRGRPTEAGTLAMKNLIERSRTRSAGERPAMSSASQAVQSAVQLVTMKGQQKRALNATQNSQASRRPSNGNLRAADARSARSTSSRYRAN